MDIILKEATLAYSLGCLVLTPCLSYFCSTQQLKIENSDILLDGVTVTINLSCQTEKLSGSFRSVSLW